MPACAPHSSLGFLVKRKRISTSSYRSFSGHASIIWVSFAIPTKKTLPRSTCLTKSLHEKAIVDFENSCPCNARSLEPTTGKKKDRSCRCWSKDPAKNMNGFSQVVTPDKPPTSTATCFFPKAMCNPAKSGPLKCSRLPITTWSCEYKAILPSQKHDSKKSFPCCRHVDHKIDGTSNLTAALNPLEI